MVALSVLFRVLLGQSDPLDNSSYCFCNNILSRANEAGSPTNRQGSDKTQGQGCFGPSTGGPDLQGSKLGNHLDKSFKKNEPHTGFAPFY